MSENTTEKGEVCKKSTIDRSCSECGKIKHDPLLPCENCGHPPEQVRRRIAPNGEPESRDNWL